MSSNAGYGVKGLNPEFRRNLWLEVTAHRLVATPIILGALMLLIYLVSQYDIRFLNGAALAIFGVLTLIWGSRSSSVSVISEFHGLTWDSQRMSALGPWELTWGKILGSNVFTWYAAFFAFIAYIVTLKTAALDFSIGALLLVSLCALWAQSLGLIFGLVSVVRKDVSIRADYGVAGGVVVGMFVLFAMSFFALRNSGRAVQWHFLTFYVSEFCIYTAAAFLFWSVFGAYTLMRLELQFRTTFLPWLAFVMFMMIYFSGFSAEVAQKGLSAYEAGVSMSFCVALLLTYMMLFVQKKDPVRFRALVRSVGAGDFKSLVRLIPNWMVSVPVVAVMALWSELAMQENLHYAFLTMFFFMARDAALIIFLNLGKNAKRADMSAVIYLAVLYGLIPGILSSLRVKELLFVAYPAISDYGLAAAIVEAAVAAAVLMARWRRNFAAVSCPIQQL